jgi:hypothetical protein
MATTPTPINLSIEIPDPIPGPQGDAGPHGPQGPVGATGPAGSSGLSIPGGRLTLVSGQPEMPQTSDYTSMALYYAPFTGDTIPIFDGATWASCPFTSGPLDTVGLSMAGGAKWLANSQRDVFVVLVGGSTVLATGPAWPSSSVSARGLVRRSGIWVNAASMALDLSATSSVTVPANQAAWLGSIDIGSTAGTLQALFTQGQNRRCDVWNVYNQREIALEVGCPPASATLPVVWLPANQFPALVAFNNDLSNSGRYFTGLPQNIDREYSQSCFINTYGHGAGGVTISICEDSLTNPTTTKGFSSDCESAATGYFESGLSVTSHSIHRSSVGGHRAIMGVAGSNHFTGVTLYGMDPRAIYGSPDRLHALWLKYQG